MGKTSHLRIGEQLTVWKYSRDEDSSFEFTAELLHTSTLRHRIKWAWRLLRGHYSQIKTLTISTYPTESPVEVDPLA